METATASSEAMHDDKEYEHFLLTIRERFADSVASGSRLFTTETENLFQSFLNELPAGDIRQHYTCHACRRFTDTYGGLVTISPEGKTSPAIWNIKKVPDLYVPSVQRLASIASKAKVTGVFFTSEKVWGQPVTGPWHHMALTPPQELVFRTRTLTPFQVMAEKKEDFTTLKRGLSEFPIEATEQALKVLKLDALYRSEKCLGVAEWLHDLQKRIAGLKNKRAIDNIIWSAIASAPPGFAHIRSTMIGTLLEDIVAGMSFDTISKRFADKMHPLQYRRPQAPPSSGNIAQAEKIIEQLRAAGSLSRRFARLEEIEAIWRPVLDMPKNSEPGSVFGHLKSKGKREVKSLEVPASTMTWDKFQRTVLPEAKNIQFKVPMTRANFSAIVTAEDPDAPPIIQWDFEENRNPFSQYVYHSGSNASDWNLSAGEMVNVNAICFTPSMWRGNEKFKHQGQAVIFILDGAWDTRSEHSGLALFPEILKSELHSIRATIEAYSRHGKLGGQKEATACGYKFESKPSVAVNLTVTSSDGQRISYKIDRWD